MLLNIFTPIAFLTSLSLTHLSILLNQYNLHFFSKSETFGHQLQTIQNAASQLISLQGVLKKQHKLNSNDRKVYTENLTKLSQAAQKLAQMEEEVADMSLHTLFSGRIY